MAELDSREDDELAEIELTYTILDDINQARPERGRPNVCIIQVQCFARQVWQYDYAWQSRSVWRSLPYEVSPLRIGSLTRALR